MQKGLLATGDAYLLEHNEATGRDPGGWSENNDGITAEVEVGRVYEGPMICIMNPGAVFQPLPGRDGLPHISQIANRE